MVLQQDVKDEILRQLQDGRWHTPDEIWLQVTNEQLDHPAQDDKTMQALLIETYAAVQQTLIDLALAERLESTKDGRIRIKPERKELPAQDERFTYVVPACSCLPAVGWAETIAHTT